MNYERVMAADVKVGDLIARTRTQQFHRVTRVTHGPRAAWFFGAAHPGPYYRRPPGAREGEWIIMRPLLTAKLWREVANA